MLPYIEQHAIQVGALRIYPFGILVGAGVLTGIWMLRVRAERRGFDRQVTLRFCAALILGGMAGSYFLRLLLSAGPIDLQQGGLSSCGALSGGLACGWLYLRRLGLGSARIWEYVDLPAFVCPFGWALCRAGCSIAHDHPGIRANNWLSVNFPGGPRYDLGLLEFLFVLPVIALFWWLDRYPRPGGLYLGLGLILYGPFRFCLDGLREHEGARGFLSAERIWGLLATAGGIILLAKVLRRPAPARQRVVVS